MAKHVWKWDKKSSNPMMVFCVRCGRKVPLAEAIDEVGCNGCPVEGVQEQLFNDLRHDRRGYEVWRGR
jgi:hypothetical protein